MMKALSVLCVLLASANAITDRAKDFNLKTRPGIVTLYTKSNIKDFKDKPYNEPLKEVVRAPKPNCAGNENFCRHDDEYPMAKVLETLDLYHGQAHRMYHASQPYPLEQQSARNNSANGRFVCETQSTPLRPGWARNRNDQWMAVVNTEKFPQTIMVETCSYAGKKCEYLPPCYKSSCVQRTTFVQLLSVDPSNVHHRPVMDVFEVPSACSCFVEDFTFY